MRCIKTLAPQIGNPNCATRIWMNIFGWENFAAWWILLGWGLVKFVVCAVFFLKRKIKTINCANSSRQTSPHTFTTYLLRHFAANFAGKTSPAKICQQNLASYLHLTNKYVALVGTYTNMHVNRYELGNNWTQRTITKFHSNFILQEIWPKKCHL